MPKVDISINGRLYPVACDEGQEGRLRDLAGLLDQRVRQLAGPSPVGAVGETQILVLAGLMLADELTETKAYLESHHAGHDHDAPAPAAAPAAEGLVDEELLIAAVDHLTDRIAVIADRLQQA
jgi:cell division protein ZapA